MYDLTVMAVVLSTVAGGTAAAWLIARHDPRSSAFAFGGFLLVLTFWTATHFGTLFANSEQWLLLFTQFSYVGVVAAPVVWFAFSLRYTDRGDWLSWRRLGLLSVVPATTLVVVFTIPYHPLFYTSIEAVVVDGVPLIRTEPGPWHLLNVVYSYALLLAGSGILLASALSNNRLYRRQSAVLLVCIMVPWIVNAGYHLGVRPIPWVDPTPMAFIATGIPLAVVVVRTDLASFLPVAHERVFRSLDDPMVVVSPDGTVIDANEAARSRLRTGESSERAHVTEVLPDALLDGGILRTDLDGAIECTVKTDGGTRQYLARRQSVEPSRDGVSRGSVVALTDITARKARERELERLSEQTRQQNRHLERMADIVAHDMQTPLSTAEKLLTLLRADIDQPDADVQQSLDDLTDVLDHLDAFAEHIPQLAREATDVGTVETCDLEAVVREAWEVVETDDVELAVMDTRSLEADRGRLLQVFENLVGNAVEHGRLERSVRETEHVSDGGTEGPEPSEGACDRPPESVVTTVRVGTTDDGLYVEDDGPGIPADRREDVFRYGVSTGDGSGFGLAIVRTVVEAHGWDIDVTESHPDGQPTDAEPQPGTSWPGTRFEIHLDD